MQVRLTNKAKKNIGRLILLLVIYLVAVIIFFMLSINRGTTDLTQELQDATFPVVHFLCGENEINETYGYSNEMNATYIRNTITPMESDRKLAFTINTYGTEVSGLSYELRSMNGERLLENNDIRDYSQEGNLLRAELTLQNLMDDSTEYVFMLKLTTARGPIYYYTRVMKEVEGESEEILDFVSKFHNATFSPNESTLIENHIETNTALAKSTLSYVDIHSSELKIRWGGEAPTIESKEQFYISEISPYYSAVKVNYIVSKIEDGSSKYYNIEEYYRLRVGEKDIYLYDFERTTNQIFTVNSAKYEKNQIEIGVTEGKIEYEANSSGTMLAFVKEGDLWLYDEAQSEIIKVFSFRGDDLTDSRQTNTKHSIKVLNIDESGTILFVVSGYMSRGDHEGQVGVGIYRYSRSANVVEEELWVASDKSASVVGLDTEGLFYISSSNTFYMMINGTLYSIDVLKQSATVLQENLDADSFLVSESGRRIAWVNQSEVDHSRSIQVMDLETETISTIQGDNNSEYLKPLAYLQEDFVYGVANMNDLDRDVAGNTYFIMNKVVILDEDMNQIKSYKQENCFVENAYVEDEVLHLVRVAKTEEGYVSVAEDTIINYNLSETAYNQYIDVSTDSDIGSGRMAITMADEITNPNPRVVATENMVKENVSTITILKQEEDAGRYFVYRACDAVLSTRTLSKAITLASETGGAVLGEGQSYIWRRGRGSMITINDLDYPETANDSGSQAQCIDTILDLEGVSNNAERYLEAGSDIYETMVATLDDYRVLNLTGCAVDDILYYVARSTPVLAMVDSSEAVLIVGYDSYNITIYQPDTKTYSKISLDEADNYFSLGGNVFIGYLR